MSDEQGVRGVCCWWVLSRACVRVYLFPAHACVFSSLLCACVSMYSVRVCMRACVCGRACVCVCVRARSLDGFVVRQGCDDEPLAFGIPRFA